MAERSVHQSPPSLTAQRKSRTNHNSNRNVLVYLKQTGLLLEITTIYRTEHKLLLSFKFKLFDRLVKSDL